MTPCFSKFKDILFNLSRLRLSTMLYLTEVKVQVNNLLHMKNHCLIMENSEIMGQIVRAKTHFRIVHQLLARGHKKWTGNTVLCDRNAKSLQKFYKIPTFVTLCYDVINGQ